MPIYLYECARCGNCFEKTLPMASAPKSTKCPACGGRARKIIGPVQRPIVKGG